jgi:hypothetical protein
VSDVKLGHLGQTSYVGDIQIIKAVSGVQRESRGQRRLAGARQGRELQGAIVPFKSVCVSPGVQLDGDGAKLGGDFHLRRVGVDEQAHGQPGVSTPRDRFRDAVSVADDVKPALGGHFLAALRHERDLIGSQFERDLYDFRSDRRLKIEPSSHRLAQDSQISILDMPPIFAEMDCDSVSARELGERRGPDRVGLAAAASLADRGDVIDVHSQSRHGRRSFGLQSDTLALREVLSEGCALILILMILVDASA